MVIPYEKWVKFPVDVVIEYRPTGERRTYRTEECIDPELGEWSDFIWSEGNYACDCNRELFFCRAIGAEEPEHSGRCNETKYRIVSIAAVENGEVLYEEP